ncbi:MAG: hypothetical protein ACOC44_09355 [Promethearchaeia archaeon]
MVQDPSNVKDPVDINDIEDFINGLQITFDSLDEANTSDIKGYQSKLAKAISNLRIKKIAKAEPEFDKVRNMDREELKNYLLQQLKDLKQILENNEFRSGRKKFDILMKMTKLREKITHFL